MFKKNPHSTNFILEGNGFFLSYNPSLCDGMAFFSPDTLLEETALVDTSTDDYKYFILNGDFREEYESVVAEGFEACFGVYTKHNDKHSSWSSDVDPADFIIARLKNMQEKGDKEYFE